MFLFIPLTDVKSWTVTYQNLCIPIHPQYNVDREIWPVVFVVSTTGDGDPPDTAQKFVRKIKNKTLPHNHLSHLRYALLGKMILQLCKRELHP